MSDTHLEFKHNVPVCVTGDILVLTGDIGTLDDVHRQFVEACALLFRHVVVIMGNHECWSAKGVEHKIRQAEEMYTSFPNVHFLNRGHVDLMGIRFLGCTMWTKIPIEHAFVVEEFINDYRRIRVKRDGRKHKITHNDVQEWHFRDKMWLQDQIERSELPVVVVTHHSPLFDLAPKPLDYGYDGRCKAVVSRSYASL